MIQLPRSLLKVPERVQARIRQIIEKLPQLDPLELWRIQSLAVRLSCDEVARKAYLSRLSAREKLALKYNWRFWARKDQLPPAGRWFIWLLMAGRGFGKTRCGSQWVIEQARAMPGSHGALIGPTVADVRDVMIGGESGILACSPRDFVPEYEPSKRLLTWRHPKTGLKTTALTFSADRPERLRGPQFHWFWADELGAWRFSKYAWEMISKCHRLDYHGQQPRGVVTTTPRPIPLIRELVENAKRDRTVITKGTSFSNIFHLAGKFFRDILNSLGSRLSQQEALGILLDALDGALWTKSQIREVDKAPDLVRTVVGCDPAEDDKPTADEVGIVPVGADRKGNGYVLDDYSMRGSPEKWGRRVLDCYYDFGADAIVAEINSGGQMVPHVILSCLREGESPPRIITVRAKKAKRTRAEPIHARYELGRQFHVGFLAQLVDEMTSWVPGVDSSSPDNRLDAMVWASTELFLDDAFVRGHEETPPEFEYPDLDYEEFS